MGHVPVGTGIVIGLGGRSLPATGSAWLGHARTVGVGALWFPAAVRSSLSFLRNDNRLEPVHARGNCSRLPSEYGRRGPCPEHIDGCRVAGDLCFARALAVRLAHPLGVGVRNGIAGSRDRDVLVGQADRIRMAKRMSPPKQSWWRVVLVVALCPLVFQAGCVGAAAQLLYVIKGTKQKAQFSGLIGKRVAVVCVTDNAAYRGDTLSGSINKVVSAQLKKSVKKCQVISPAKVEEWIDTHEWDRTNFAEMGRGVDAEIVVAIQLSSYTIKEGQTLYKGRVNLAVTVFDVSRGGEIVFSHGPMDYIFPKNGRPAIQTSEQQFETVYLAKLTDYIARLFYDSDRLDNVAEDASML